MKYCKICGKPADTDRLLCKECYRLSRNGHLGKSLPEGKDFIVNDKHYIVTKDGRVFSAITYKFITPITMKNGYIMYSFGSGTKRRQLYAHRLVAYCFGLLDSLDSPMCIDHIDSNKANNTLENLRVVTYSENEVYKRMHSGLLYAEKDGVMHGPYNSVKEMYAGLNMSCSLGSFYTQVSRGAGYGYTFTREHRGN